MSWTIIDVAIGQGTGGGGGGGGIPNPNSGVLGDNEMVKANAGGTAIVGTGDTNTASEVNFGAKNIVTSGTVTSGTGTFILGEAIADSSAGENKTTTNLVSGKRFNPVWIDQDENIPKARLVFGPELEEVQEASTADILINPSWQSNPVVDWRVVKLTLETDTTITNAIFSVTKNGAAFYSARIGTMTANVESVTDLTDPSTPENVPAEAFIGDTYIASVTSEDGPVRLKGSTANLLPFFKVGYFPFVDRVVLDEQSSDFGDIEKTMTLKSNGPASYDQATGELILIPYQDLVTSNQTIASVVQPVTAQLSSSYITGIEIGYLFAQTDVRITVETAGGDVTFLTDVISGTTLIKLPEPLKLQPLEVYQFTVDNSLTVGGDAIMGGNVSTQFDIFYNIEVEVIKTRNLDPDQRIQNRTIQMPLTQIGYIAQIGGGVLADQGWTDESTGTATLVPQIDPADGGFSLKSTDTTSGGLTLMTRAIDDDPVDALNRLFTNGGWIGFNLRAESESSDVSASAGLGFSAADDPGYKGGTRGRWLFSSSIESGSGEQRITPEGGSEIDTGIPSDEYVYVGVSVKPGTMIGDIYINGALELEDYDFSGAASNSTYDNQIVYGSGGTSSVGRINWLRSADLVIFNSGPALPFSKRLIEDNTVGILPVNVYRDWTLTFLDVEVERKSTGMLIMPNWGTVTLSRIGNEVTFNGKDGMIIQGPGSIEVSQVNLDDESPDKKYQVSFFGGAAEIESIGDYDVIASIGYTRAERVILLSTAALNSRDVTLNPSSTTADTLALVGQELQAFLATPIKDGVMSQADKISLDDLAANVPFEAIKKTAGFLVGNGLRYLVDTSGGALTVTIDATVETFWIGDYDNTWTNTNTVSVVVGVDTIVLNMSNRNEVFMFTRQGSVFRVYDGSGAFKVEGNI